MQQNELVKDGSMDSAGYTLQGVYENSKLNARTITYAFILCVGFIIEGWEMTIVSFMMTDIAQEFSLDATQTGFMASVLYIGMLVGAYLWGPFGEKYGRRSTFSLGLCGYGVFTILCALSHGYIWFLTLRFISGVMFTALAVVVFPYYEELLPSKSRGNMTPLLAAGWPVGTILAALLSRHIIPSLGWRSALIVSGAIGAWGILSFILVPESPIWLATKGKCECAQRNAVKLFPEFRAAMNKIECTVTKTAAEGTFLDLFKTDFRMLTIKVFAINFVYSWGYWGLYLWLPSMLVSKGMSFVGSTDFMIFSALAQIPGYVIAAVLCKKIGRKSTLIPFAAFAAVFGVVFALVTSSTAGLIIFALMSFFNLGGWGVWNTWMSELFPTLVRNTGTGWGIGAQKLANVVAPIVNGFLVSIGCGLPVMIGVAVAFLIITCIIAKTFKETEGTSLV